MIENARLKYVGSTPGGDSNTYNLLNTVLIPAPRDLFAMLGLHRLTLDLKCSQSGTLKWYFSDDRGTNWIQIGQEAITAPASTDTLVRDFLVEPYPDFKLDWANGGSAQATWNIHLTLVGERSLAG